MKKEKPGEQNQSRKEFLQQITNFNSRKSNSRQKKQKVEEEFSIYNDPRQSPLAIQSQSSFELEQEKKDQKNHKNQAIEKVLFRLGLNNKPGKKNNQQLQIVVGNIVENCVGTVDAEINTQQYERIYLADYKQRLKSSKHSVSILVNQLTDLQKIELFNEKGILGVYKYIRLILKKVSMLCETIVEHNLFETAILLIIVLNSVKMALDDPLSSQESNPTIQNTFIVLYTLQMTLKMFAHGLVMSNKAYLRDPWNILDCIIVITSLLPLVITIKFSVNALRAIRVLRPLKTITKVKALKMIVSTLFHSFSLVMDSLYILTFVMIVLAIAGTQLFSGLLKNRCIELATGTLTDQLCTTGDCDSGFECGRGISSPNFSINNFDTFLWSLLSVFRTLTMEGWSGIMLGLQKVYSPFSFIYSVMIVFLCEYVLLNMTLAILKYKYSQVKGNTIKVEEEQKTDYQPQFLKKLGIFKQISRMPNELPLSRYSADDKIFLGSKYFFNDTTSISENPFLYEISKLRKTSEKLTGKLHSRKIKKESINIDQLRGLGKVESQRWDPKTLCFEAQLQSAPDHKRRKQSVHSHRSERPRVEKHIVETKQGQQNLEYSSDSFGSCSSNEGYSEDDEIQANNKIFQLNKRLKSSKKIEDSPFPIKVSHQMTKQIKNTVVYRKQTQLQQLDKILGIVSKQSLKERRQVSRNFIDIPEVNIEEIQVEKLYDKFNDLGQYRIKRIEKPNDLDFFKINHKKSSIQCNKTQNSVLQILEDNSLDIKELQLVNQLSRKQMKCRIKGKEQLNERVMYDQTRVLVSKTIKQLEKKKKELHENIENMNFKVRYKLPAKHSLEENKYSSSLFLRNVHKQRNGLKIPQLWWKKDQQKLTPSHKKQYQSQQNDYLRQLQSRKMEQKIQIEQNRLMQVFFKKDKLKIQKKEEQQAALEREYHAIKEGDIYTRQGNIVMTACLDKNLLWRTYESINVRPEEYQVYVRGLFGMVSVLRKKTLLFITTGFYDNIMLLFVIANTITLSLNGLLSTDQQIFIILNTIFTVVFTIDLTLKIFSYGFEFFGDIMNLFDAFVVSISLVELSIGTGSNLSALRSIKILRAFRVLRVTRLLRTLNYMKIVMAVVSSVITEFVYIFMLLALFIFIYTLLGMQIFGGTLLPFAITGIRQNFDTFFDAVFSVFQVLTVQNWNDIETVILTSQSGVISVFYLISWIFIGNWILLNLLQAILLDGFDKDSSPEQHEEKDMTVQKTQQDKKLDNSKYTNSINKIQEQKEQTTSQVSQKEDNFQSQDASLLIFLPQSFVRKVCWKVSSSRIFQNLIVVMISLSTIKLIMDTYLYAEQVEFIEIMDNLDILFNSIFIFESMINIIAKGFIFGQKAYLKDSWSRLDFFIVVTAVADMTLGIDLSILKLFRTLRPLRIVSRNPDMKIIISSLAESMLGILNVLIIILMVFLMFGILGINLLQGKLNYCNSSTQLTYGTYGPYGVDQVTCQAQGGVWSTQFINFDNIVNALLSLYVFSTRENWPYYVYTFFDADLNGPVKDNSRAIFMVYSVVIIFVCSYFFMDLLIGVLFLNFHEAQAKIRPKTLSDKQINWKNLQKVIIQEDPCFQLYLKPENRFRSFFYSIVILKGFDLFITFCILGNIVVMMIATDDQSRTKTDVLSNMNFAFNIVFITEMVLKLCAFSKGYFLSGWNIFDFFVVMASLLDIILGLAGAKNGASAALSILPQIARIFRVLRITRLLRMFKRFKGLQKLIQTFIFSFPALGKGLALVVLFLMIFSVLASNLFSNIEYDYAGNITKGNNFSNFHNSFQLLFIMTTGQNWYFYMFESIQSGYVHCKSGTTCTQSYYIIFWLIYVFFSQKVFMELFVLIVLDQFEANYINENNPLGIFSLFEEDFRNNWIQHTIKYQSQKIQVKKLMDLLMVLKQPLGLGKNQLIAKYEDQLRQNQKNTQEDIQVSLNDLQSKLKKNAAKLLNKMPVIKNRMYLGYHQTFYNFAKISIVSQFYDSATEHQKHALEAMHCESEDQLQKMRPQGNIFFYEEAEGVQLKQPLNPIELILFCQMIVKSWHNYSIKYHSNTHKIGKKKSTKDYQANQSLNDSCASDIVEANFHKLPSHARRLVQRRGMMENNTHRQSTFEFRILPNIMEHYKYDKKRMRSRISRQDNKLRKVSQLKNIEQNLKSQTKKNQQ